MAASLAQRDRPASPFADTRVARREWNGATVNLSQWWGEGEVCSNMTYQADVRLTALLEETGPSHCEPRLSRALGKQDRTAYPARWASRLRASSLERSPV